MTHLSNRHSGKRRFMRQLLFGGLMLAAWLVMGMGASARAADVIQICNVFISPAESTVEIQAQPPGIESRPQSVMVLRLPGNPPSLVLDIPNAELCRSVPRTIKPEGVPVSKIKLTQSRTPFYRAVRVVLELDPSLAPALESLNPKIAGGSIQVALTPQAITTAGPSGGAGPPSTATTARQPLIPPGQEAIPRPAGTTVIDRIQLERDGGLVLNAAGADANLRVSNRLVLPNPTRLVLDLGNTVLAHKGLVQTYEVNSRDLDRIRVGQFDERTVRLVLETSYPERFRALYTGADKATLAIRNASGTALASMPDNVALGDLEDVVLKHLRSQHLTQIVIKTSVPMVTQIGKQGQELVLNLPNIAARYGPLQVDKSLFPSHLETLKIEPLVASEQSAKLVIGLQHANIPYTFSFNPDRTELTLALSDAPEPTPAELEVAGAQVVVDAGHGGKDIGANRDGVYEKNLNLSVALKLRDELKKRGLKVAMTRSTDEFLPLSTITAITNRIHPTVFVSVHTNASTNPSVYGIETYYYHGRSLPLARAVHARLTARVSSPDRGVRQARFYVINHTPVPAILCEMGYISNSSERDQLQSEARQWATARAIADGVVDYLNATRGR